MIKFLLYVILFYFCFKFLFRLIAPFLLKKMASKLQEDLFKRTSNSSNFNKKKSGDTEVSYKKENDIDPGGEYVDFEDLNDEK